MVYVTGDMHGDFGRFKRLKKNDTLIICGDFGFIWTGSTSESSILKKIGKFKYNVAFIDGTHENFDLLEGYPITQWYGGQARQISGRLVHLMRGEIYHIEGKEIFTFGGGASDDYDMRVESGTWYKREQPSGVEIQNARTNLSKFHNKIDYIITHEPPQCVKACLGIGKDEFYEIDALLDNITKEVTYKQWFFGKVHKNKRVPPLFSGVYDDIICLQ